MRLREGGGLLWSEMGGYSELRGGRKAGKVEAMESIEWRKAVDGKGSYVEW